MALVSKLGAALAGSAERVVDAPVRAILEDLLKERGVPGAQDLAAARSEISQLKSQQSALSDRLSAVEARSTAVEGELQSLLSTIDELQRDLAESREQLVQAQAEADEARTLAAAALERAEAPQESSGSAEEAADDRPLVGEDGAVQVRDTTYYVDAALAGEPYTVTSRGSLAIAGRFVKRHKQPVGVLS